MVVIIRRSDHNAEELHCEPTLCCPGASLLSYKYRDLTIQETTSVITQYKDLKPVMDSYVFNDGSSRELMSLSGTIPVPYRGNTYNIPICLWLLDTYPFNPPICFVKPTSSMTIKTGKHVDANGKIYLPYLHEWKYPQSDLLELIQVMIVVFGEEPPVFSRPTASSSYPPYQATGPPTTTTSVQYYPSQPPVTTVGPSRDGTISEDTIRASLISAVSDKLRWRMKEEMDRAQAELNALKRTEEDLKKGHQKLEEMVTRLDQEVAEVDKNIELLKKKDEELSSALEKMESQSENSDIDEVIIPTAPLYKQILNLYAEENAIEDTIFYLGEALRRGVIDLDVFLKHVRLLSRKQFQLRALMQKARKTAGLNFTLTTGISMLSNDPSMAAQGVDAQPFSHEVAETGRVQIAATTNNTVFGEATDLPGHIGQNIHCEENRGVTSATHEQTDNEDGTFQSSEEAAMLEIQHLSSELVLHNINKGEFISQVLQETKNNGKVLLLLPPKLDTYLHEDADGTGHSDGTHANHANLIFSMTLLFVESVDELILERHGALLKGKQQIIRLLLQALELLLTPEYLYPLHSILVGWVLAAKGVPKWHGDARGLCIYPRLRVEGSTTLSQEMVLHWEQPEEPRAGAAAQTDASTHHTSLVLNRQQLVQSMRSQAEQQVRTLSFGAEGRDRKPAAPIFRKNQPSYVSLHVPKPPESWP
ncbi:hypothetical protein IHE44_0006392 [Lamprotornis superbus]|uniref:Tumor susceptibility gene 101 protein n=1 Tax=Lamprotornis superbus TaxID=245042 RepID=A0A835NER7_9PASS|nr:hypothetical protein IHE44_0006392 [Lamprotornis superbus]